MKIANGLEMLEISANIMGKLTSIFPTVFYDKDNVILVDTGYPNQLPLFVNAFNTSGISFGKLNKIIVTHHDVDHIGSLSDILEQSSIHIETLTHKIEKSYIQGEKRPVKLSLLESKLDFLPEQMKPLYSSLKTFYNNLKVNIDRTISDGEELPLCGGISVIYTPGHTPGHICLYHKKSKTLISGDALVVENGILNATQSSINFAQDLYIKSLRKLTEYDIESVICYHGGLYNGNVTTRISELADSLDI